MARPYCTIEDVRRILRTATKKVRTSESYRELNYDRNNTGTVRLTAVDFLDSYAGTERFELEFSDSLNFEAVGEETGYLGAGDMSSTFVCTKFTVSPSYWRGTPVTGDIVFFTSDSNISVNDANGFIDGVGAWINNGLGAAYGDTTNIPWEADYGIAVPDALKYVAEYRAACEIFRSVYAGSELDESPVETWCGSAGKTLAEFVDWKETDGAQSSPRWISRDTFAKNLGVAGEGDGVMDVTVDSEKDESYTR